ncbi:hypothetical protein LG299_11270 [Microbacterium lacus]|uniref:hypothetical protein n=1 Tax=Microbacterium lacus TaxID=415217 RepID=UPI003850C91A
MPEIVAAILQWAVPALVVFGVTAIALAVIVWAIRQARRSPRARKAAEAQRDHAGVALVRLDDAVDELDLEVGLSGALYGGGAPSSLRRARLSAGHVRDASFEEYRTISGSDASPADIRRVAARIRSRSDSALKSIEKARVEHSAWVHANVSAPQQIAAAKARLAAVRAALGDPAALVSDLSSRFAEEEWASASSAAAAAVDEADSAEAALARATAHADDPTRSALADVAEAERSLRRAETEARTLEETHRLVSQASLAVEGELTAARTAVRQAMTIRESLEPVDGERLGLEIRAVIEGLDAAEATAVRHPTRAIDAIARLRDRLDLALGDARTAQQRLRGARTALPGTLAAARAVVVRAEASVAHSHAGADARARLMSAQSELASARGSDDPVAALDAARRAMRDAEDAIALADYSHRGQR